MTSENHPESWVIKWEDELPLVINSYKISSEYQEILVLSID